MITKEFSRMVLTIAVTALSSSLLTGYLAIRYLSAQNNASTAGPENSEVVELIKEADPAVVAITVSKNIPVYEQVPGPFDDFFDFIPRFRENGTREVEVGGGSGFLVSSHGYIVTNRHVVSDEDAEYAVFLNNGRRYDARVMVRDPNFDIAIIKISGTNFAFLEFGDSDKVEVGESVIAIGNALAEFRNTVSMGIVSGLSRSIIASDSRGRREPLNQLIQTDAAINPGNSGGPLLNLEGKVIGVSVAFASEAENIAFAISSNSVMRTLENIEIAISSR